MKNILAILLTIIAITVNALAGAASPTQVRKTGAEMATNRQASAVVTTNQPVRAVGLTNYVQSASLFGENELILDLAITYAVGEPRGLDKFLDTNARGGQFGAAIGLTKFFNANFGLGAETGIANIDHINSIDYLNVLAVGRLPFEHFAPYVLAGVGRELHAGIYDGIIGGGIEYRFTPKLGAFAEARFIFREASPDAGMGRLGIRFVF